ncbi:MAG: hypothetical protein K5870_04600 [Lachnospiraceae bacterium]|nr:hypothetical protein [Lachnospiraceae bacterium]
MDFFKDQKKKTDSVLAKKEIKESLKDTAKEAEIPLDMETMNKVAGGGGFFSAPKPPR